MDNYAIDYLNRSVFIINNFYFYCISLYGIFSMLNKDKQP